MKTVAIIGAGAAGLSAANYLAIKGFRVTIFEKNAFPGGRCASFEKEGHRFDIGATLLMMPQVYERMYTDFGRNMHDELDLIRMDPVYRLRYADGSELKFTSDLMRMQDQLEAMEPGSYTAFLRYMDKSFKAYKVSMETIIDRNYDNIFQFINPVNLFRLFRLNAFGNHYRTSARYFKNENLRTAFTFQNIYVGQNPFEAMAIFSMLPFMELTDGVYFPKGGMNRVSESLEKIAIGNGVEIQYRANVSGIRVAGERVAGIELADGTFYEADIVLANADLPYVYQELLPSGPQANRIKKLGYTCSAIVFHWGMDTVLPGIEQHNVYVSDNYRDNIEEVFNGSGFAPEPSFYLHSPARADKSAAPEGHDSISVIVPVGHMGNGKFGDLKIGGLGDLGIDWEVKKEEARAAVLKRLASEGFADFEKHIKFEKVYNPVIWKNMFNLSKGATFGSLNHNLMQMGYFRPHNQHNKYKNLFFAGGSTHPGNGVPLALISARLTAEKIIGVNGER
ncbi:MAG: phytoene desaturase [Bacteroidales bacterium]|nr:phytoene desaturase [Bacteroidales bacterium]